MSITSDANSTFLEVDNAHLRVSGDIHATSVKVGAIEILPGYSLESTTVIGNTTSQTIQFTNTETSLVTSGDINMLHSSNNAAIKLNSNVVAEFPRSKKLIKYPRVAMTQNDESGTSGYVVEQTNTASHGNADAYAYRLFDNTSGAYQSGSAYSGGIPTSSAPTTTASDGSTHQGVAITLDLVTKIRLDHAVFTSHANYGRTPVDGTFLGSNNSSTWDVIQTFSGLSTSGDNQKHTINITNSSQKLAYRYIRFVITKTHTSSVFNGGGLLEFRELEYYGIPEYDPDAAGLDVKVTSYPNVPNTDWLEVYYDGQDYTSMPATVTDKSGNNRTGTPSGGVGFDSEYKAFTFDGANDYISSTTTATLSNHTASMWIKFDSPSAWEAVYSIKPASGFDRNNFILYLNSTYFRLESSGNTGPYYDLAYNFVIGKWVHLTLVFRGSGLGDCEMYIDNVRLHPDGGQRSLTDDITITGTNTIYVGSDPSGSTQYYLDGSIANFRLFNRALSSDEIYQLYAYQKEYFGYGDLSMTLKAGRLGIGTSEPRAALDVRGSFRAPGTIVQVEQSIKRNDSSTTSTSVSDIPGLSVTIHPKFGASKILVSYQINMGGNYHMFLRVKRTQNGATTYVGNGNASGNRPLASSYQSHLHQAHVNSMNMEILDPANGMYPITYQVQFWVAHTNYTAWINRGTDNYNNEYGPGALSSSITVKEVCQ